MVKKALLVGINYTGTSSSLNGCINDVEVMRLLLSTRFKFDSIKTCTDNTFEKPTRATMERLIIELVTGAKAGDTLVFHYSGHGSNITDRTGDESDSRDEVLVPLDYKTRGVISDDWIFENLCKKVPKGVTLWCFSDCCHSGTMLDLKYNIQSRCIPKKTGLVKYNTVDWTNNFAFSVEKRGDIEGKVLCLSGCQDKETSADVTVNGKGQGAFTKCLNEALADGASVTVREILKEVNVLLDLNKYSQNSQLSLSSLSFVDEIFKL